MISIYTVAYLSRRCLYLKGKRNVLSWKNKKSFNNYQQVLILVRIENRSLVSTKAVSVPAFIDMNLAF